jgi:hypothetical protein
MAADDRKMKERSDAPKTRAAAERFSIAIKETSPKPAEPPFGRANAIAPIRQNRKGAVAYAYVSGFRV